MRPITPLLDQLILRPTRNPILGPNPTHQLECGGVTIEAWAYQIDARPVDCDASTSAPLIDARPVDCDASTSALFPELSVIRLLGVSGRAESVSAHPYDTWPDVGGQFWVANPPGYGGSQGCASLKGFLQAGRSIHQKIRSLNSDGPILLVGSSLGATTALALATELDVDGLLLRDPPDLRRVILTRYGKWTLWLPALLLASGLPSEMNALSNAAKCTVPALFITSGADRTVPYRCQQAVCAAYGGPWREFHLPAAVHGESIPQQRHAEYREALGWLRELVLRKRITV